MIHQLDSNMALVTGFLYSEPTERKDKTGRRMVMLDVAYDRLNHRNNDGSRRSRMLRLPVFIFGEYTSYARTLQKGDCVMCVGLRPIEPPKGYTANPMLIGRMNFGFIGGTGIQRAWTSEADAYTRNQLARTKKPKKEKSDEDKFSEIRGDWY